MHECRTLNGLPIIFYLFYSSSTFVSFEIYDNALLLQAPSGTTMLGVFGALSSSIPFQKRLNEPHTEGVINRLHYSFTVLVFFGCSLLVTCLGKR